MVLGILSFLGSVLTAIPAIVCGQIALSKINLSAHPMEGKPKAITGLILGYLHLVIFGIFVLMSSVIPGVTAVVNAGKAKDARRVISRLKAANLSHFTEYREYPFTGDEKTVFQSDESLINNLMGENLRGLVFYSDREARPSRKGGFQGGLSTSVDGENSSTKLWDPWGNHYRLKFDLDGNGTIETPDGTGSIPARILIWSAGVDGQDATKDDVKSWFP